MANVLASPAIDRTGLAGVYDVRLEWPPDQVALGPSDRSSGSEPAISVFTAIREQLGLSLRADKMRVDVVIVDRIERAPTEN